MSHSADSGHLILSAGATSPHLKFRPESAGLTHPLFQVNIISTLNETNRTNNTTLAMINLMINLT